jgi:hypothetical protein
MKTLTRDEIIKTIGEYAEYSTKEQLEKENWLREHATKCQGFILYLQTDRELDQYIEFLRWLKEGMEDFISEWEMVESETVQAEVDNCRWVLGCIENFEKAKSRYDLHIRGE